MITLDMEWAKSSLIVPMSNVCFLAAKCPLRKRHPPKRQPPRRHPPRPKLLRSQHRRLKRLRLFIHAMYKTSVAHLEIEEYVQTLQSGILHIAAPVENRQDPDALDSPRIIISLYLFDEGENILGRKALSNHHYSFI